MRKFDAVDIIAIGAECLCLYIITFGNLLVLHGIFVEHFLYLIYLLPVTIGIWLLCAYAIITMVMDDRY